MMTEKDFAVRMFSELARGTSLRQILDKNYPRILENYGGEIILVGINYDEHKKIHECRIEKSIHQRNEQNTDAQQPF